MSDDEIGYTEYRNDELPKRSDLPVCPVETCVSLIGSKWKLLIMRDLLLNGSMASPRRSLPRTCAAWRTRGSS